MKPRPLLIAFLLSNLLGSSIISGNFESLSDFMLLDKHDLSKIKSRYSTYKKNQDFFDKEQYALINQLDLGPTIGALLLHEYIKLPTADHIISFAQEIKQSGFLLDNLEKRIIRYIEQEEVPFYALRKAIKREVAHRFKINKNQQVRDDNNAFVHEINSLPLDQNDTDKIINAFAVCIDPYRYPDQRAYITPIICDAMDDEYKEPSFWIKEIKIREEPTSKESPRFTAYHQLMAAAREIAFSQELSTFEKVVMAKCIAEQSMRFFEPSQHPFTALQKVYAMDHKSPEETFFMKNGVCGNFSGLAFNIANELGLRDKIHLAQNGWHVYLEFRDGPNYYHAHPFNRYGNCDIIKY